MLCLLQPDYTINKSNNKNNFKLMIIATHYCFFNQTHQNALYHQCSIPANSHWMRDTKLEQCFQPFYICVQSNHLLTQIQTLLYEHYTSTSTERLQDSQRKYVYRMFFSVWILSQNVVTFSWTFELYLRHFWTNHIKTEMFPSSKIVSRVKICH